MEELIKILNKVGFKDEHVKFFTDPENRPEDLSLEDVVDQVKEHQKEVFMSTMASDIKKQAGDEAVATYQKGEKARIVKLAGLGLTRKEQESKTLDEIVEMAQETVKGIQDNAGNKDELIAQVNEWKDKAQKFKTELEETTDKMEAEIEQARTEAQKKIDSFHIEKQFNRLRDQSGEKPRTWGRESDRKIGHAYILNQIKERYDVKPDGTILNKDGSKATSWDGNSVFETVEDAYESQFNQLGFGKKSNGSETDDKVVVGGMRAKDQMSDNTKKMLERIEKAQERRPGYV